MNVLKESAVTVLSCKNIIIITFIMHFENSLATILLLLLLLLLLPLVESFGLLNDLFPFPSILDAGYPVLDLHLANVLFDVILPSVLGSSL
jgi:hypothetical protein